MNVSGVLLILIEVVSFELQFNYLSFLGFYTIEYFYTADLMGPTWSVYSSMHVTKLELDRLPLDPIQLVSSSSESDIDWNYILRMFNRGVGKFTIWPFSSNRTQLSDWISYDLSIIKLRLFYCA